MKQLLKVTHWVESLICAEKIDLTGAWKIVALAGDASSRQYFRVKAYDESYIVALSPVDKIDNAVFIRIANSWRSQGVRVPKVLATDSEQGLMLIEDFGECHLFDRLNTQGARCLYQQAINHLLLIQNIPATELPVFDATFLLREMLLFKSWFVEYQLQITAPACVDTAFDILIDSAQAQPQLTMHRDYHSKNILIQDNEIAIIDFQDAVKGPLAYDLVSLLRDCYVSLNQNELNSLIDFYLENLVKVNNLDLPIEKPQFVRWFDLIGLQRHLKVLGLFVRLSVEEGKDQYLDELPRVYNYVVDITSKYVELSQFHHWLVNKVEPLVVKQAWYCK